MIGEALQDIPRVLTALSEWAACVLYVSLVARRLRRGPLVVVLAVGLAALVGVQAVADALPLELWSLGMGLAALTMYALIRACAAVDRKGAGELLARAFVLAELIASLQWQLDQYFFGGAEWGPARVGLVVVVYGFAFTAAYVAERRNFPRDIEIAIDGRILAATLSIALVTFLMSNLSFVIADTPFSGRQGREVFYIRTLVDLAGFVALYATRSQRLQLRRGVEMQLMNSLLRTQHEQYVRARQQMEAVNARYHDMKQYITAVRHESDAPIRSALMDQLEESLREYAPVSVDTGNPVVDTMLTSKTAIADLDGITVTSMVDGASIDFMDVMDIVTVFGNAFDNAIEATRTVEDPEQRLIRVAVRRQDHFALLEFANFFAGEVMLADGLPQTTKDDAHHHGYGLKNIRNAVEKYGGTFTVTVADGWFILRMLVPIPD